MGFRIEFRVDDIPPKKDGAKSMWAKPTEALKIIALRTKALAAMQQASLSVPIQTRAALELSLFAPAARLESIGDLDNFIAGICDGLQKASATTPFDAIFLHPQYQAIHPRIALLENDAKLMSIVAKKLSLKPEDAPVPYYTVALILLTP